MDFLVLLSLMLKKIPPPLKCLWCHISLLRSGGSGGRVWTQPLNRSCAGTPLPSVADQCLCFSRMFWARSLAVRPGCTSDVGSQGWPSTSSDIVASGEWIGECCGVSSLDGGSDRMSILSCRGSWCRSSSQPYLSGFLLTLPALVTCRSSMGASSSFGRSTSGSACWSGISCGGRTWMSSGMPGWL